MISQVLTNVTYPAGEGDLMNLEWNGSSTEETSRGAVDVSLNDIDIAVVRKLMLLWWKARSSDFSDNSHVVGKTVVLNMSSEGVLLSVS